MNTANHYDLDEWTKYYYDITENDVREQMEEHLLSCHECMNMYLSVVENDKNIDSIEIPSPCFTKDVMNKLPMQNLAHNKHTKNQFKKIMIYYVTAASITIFLTASGLFSYINASIPRISAAAVNTKAFSGVLAHSGWSQRLTNSTSTMMDSILQNNKK